MPVVGLEPTDPKPCGGRVCLKHVRLPFSPHWQLGVRRLPFSLSRRSNNVDSRSGCEPFPSRLRSEHAALSYVLREIPPGDLDRGCPCWVRTFVKAHFSAGAFTPSLQHAPHLRTARSLLGSKPNALLLHQCGISPTHFPKWANFQLNTIR